MKRLRIDLETYSLVDLKKTGVYPYAEHPTFEVLLFGYQIDDGPVEVVDLKCGEKIPPHVVDAITDPAVIKTAYNANFERVCLARHFGRPMPPEQWRCTSVLALTLGMPGHLGAVAEVCKLPLDKQKMGIGAGLIRYFCIPCKPTKKNGERTRNLPHHEPEKWKLFVEYCRQDVVTEGALAEKLERWSPSDEEQALWCLDQRINDRGVLIDTDLVEAAIAIDGHIKAKLTEEFFNLTRISKATQVAKIKKWLEDEHDIETEKLNKEAVKDILKLTDEAAVTRALELRQLLSKSSVAKYYAMKRAVCADGRVRGLFQFYGANRTGRWAGRLVQMQNLTKSDLSPEDLALARELVKAWDLDAIEVCFGPVQPLLSELIRTAFVPPPGKKFAVVDFSAVEARGLAWGAGEAWRMEVFRTHGKIYEASAEQMFHLPPGSVDKKSPYRQKGKIAELACGYQGGPGALVTMGALKMGLKEEEFPGIIKAWRDANKKIKSFWYEMERCAKKTIKTKQSHGVPGRFRFSYESGFLFMELPSGRKLAYVKPRIVTNGDFENITYDGMDQETKVWGRVDSYGGKLVENWCQATCRDALRDALIDLEQVLPEIVGHVHDEAIVEVDEDTAEADLATAESVFGRVREWAPDLPLKGDGFVSDFYRKDA